MVRECSRIDQSMLCSQNFESLELNMHVILPEFWLPGTKCELRSRKVFHNVCNSCIHLNTCAAPRKAGQGDAQLYTVSSKKLELLAWGHLKSPFAGHRVFLLKPAWLPWPSTPTPGRADFLSTSWEPETFYTEECAQQSMTMTRASHHPTQHTDSLYFSWMSIFSFISIYNTTGENTKGVSKAR